MASKLEDRLSCLNCAQVYNETTNVKPFLTSPCGHTYCQTCLNNQIECPGCREPIENKTKNIFALNMLIQIDHTNNENENAAKALSQISNDSFIAQLLNGKIKIISTL